MSEEWTDEITNEMADDEEYKKLCEQIRTFSPERLAEALAELANKLVEEENLEKGDAINSALILFAFPYSGKRSLTEEEMTLWGNKLLEYLASGKEETIN